MHTERGDVQTPTVVHATNAYAGYLLPQLNAVIRPAPHMCNRVMAPTSFSGSKTLQNSYMVFYDDHYFTINPRSTSDGAILFGGSPTGTKQLYEYIDKNPDLATNDGLINFEPILKSVRRIGSEGFAWWAPRAEQRQTMLIAGTIRRERKCDTITLGVGSRAM